MVFFDYYEPSGSFACPVCRTPQREWQSCDGPCGMMVFREGVAGATDQRVDDDYKVTEEQLQAARLPDEFFIRANDCSCPYPTELRCRSLTGVWTSSELFTGTDDDQRLRGPERREQWQARRKWLNARPT